MWLHHVVENWILLRESNISLSTLNSKYRKLLLPIIEDHFYLKYVIIMFVLPLNALTNRIVIQVN